MVFDLSLSHAILFATAAYFFRPIVEQGLNMLEEIRYEAARAAREAAKTVKRKRRSKK